MEPQGPYVRQDLTINYDERRVAVSGRGVYLTDTEYKLLYELSINAPRVIDYDELRRRVWGARTDMGRGPIRTVVKKLRQKLGAGDTQYIFTAPKVGYRMIKGEAGDD